MLASLSDLGYVVEWRVINAADYGMPQRRRRVFFLGYLKDTALHSEATSSKNLSDWLLKSGPMGEAFPASMKKDGKSFILSGSLEELTESFNIETPEKSPFETSGIIIDRQVYTTEATPEHEGERVTLGDIILRDEEVPEEFFINEKDLSKWEYQK